MRCGYSVCAPAITNRTSFVRSSSRYPLPSQKKGISRLFSLRKLPNTVKSNISHNNCSNLQIKASASISASQDHLSMSSSASLDRIPFKVAVFSAVEYVHDFLIPHLESTFCDVRSISARLDEETAPLAAGYDAVCIFVNDVCDARVIDILADIGIKYIALRCAGYDRVDVAAANMRGIKVVRVPSYSPTSVAEFALTLIMAAARNLRLAINKLNIGNYEVSGLVGYELSGKTYGIIGTGRIGLELIKLLKGFNGRILAYDVYPSEEAKSHGAEYVDLETLLKESDVVSLHTPLLPSTKHLINGDRLHLMKPNAILVNVSRGGLIDTKALMQYLEYGDAESDIDGPHDTSNGAGAAKLAAVALDVYEREESLFFEDFTRLPAKERMKSWDNRFTVLKSLPQVTCTPHIAFLTHEALENIALTTIDNLMEAASGKESLTNEVKSVAK